MYNWLCLRQKDEYIDVLYSSQIRKLHGLVVAGVVVIVVVVVALVVVVYTFPGTPTHLIKPRVFITNR